MTNPVTTILTIAVHLPNESPVYGERSLHVSLDDEGGGVYIIIKEQSDKLNSEVLMDPAEVSVVFETAMRLLAQQTLKEALPND
jgi:hypothetical protein